jgi:hypothetical protein
MINTMLTGGTTPLRVPTRLALCRLRISLSSGYHESEGATVSANISSNKGSRNEEKQHFWKIYHRKGAEEFDMNKK